MGAIVATPESQLAAYLRSQRTLTADQVAVRTIVHDSRDLTPSERSAILKGC